MYEIPRGTTPDLKFTLPFDTAVLAECWVTLAQRGRVIINKTLSECKTEGKVLTVSLTQEETLKFDESRQIEVQLRARDSAGHAYRSQIFTADPGKLIKEGVI